jgi:hypothetical protein
LEAASDLAAAITARGKADASVIEFDNQAEAAGWKKAVTAFSGDGDQYARWVMLKKLAPSFQQMMVNTADSPIMDIFKQFSEVQGTPTGGGVAGQVGPIVAPVASKPTLEPDAVVPPVAPSTAAESPVAPSTAAESPVAPSTAAESPVASGPAGTAAEAAGPPPAEATPEAAADSPSKPAPGEARETGGQP